jgi:hypothetical protein
MVRYFADPLMSAASSGMPRLLTITSRSVRRNGIDPQCEGDIVMRLILTGLVVLALVGTLVAEEPKRFGVAADLKTYPQGTPKETLASVLKAIEMKRADYILAQLADPQFVDERVKVAGYDELLTEATAKLISDPGTVKQFQRFLKEGDWTTDETTASVRHKESGERIATFKKSADRWFLQQPNRKIAKKRANDD